MYCHRKEMDNNIFFCMVYILFIKRMQFCSASVLLIIISKIITIWHKYTIVYINSLYAKFNVVQFKKPGYHLNKLSGGKLTPKLVYFVLKKDLLNFSDAAP